MHSLRYCFGIRLLTLELCPASLSSKRLVCPSRSQHQGAPLAVLLCTRCSCMHINFDCSEASQVLLKRAANEDLFALVDTVVCGDDARIKAGKPAPDIFLVAAAEINIPPSRYEAAFICRVTTASIETV